MFLRITKTHKNFAAFVFLLLASFSLFNASNKAFAWIDALGVDESIVSLRAPNLVFSNETTINDNATGAFYRSAGPGYRLNDGDGSAFIYFLVDSQGNPIDTPIVDGLGRTVCPGVLLANENPNSNSLYFVDTVLQGGRCTLGDNRLYADWNTDVGGRNPVSTLDIAGSVTLAGVTPGPGVTLQPGGGGGGGGVAEDDTCETNSGVLGWILCPIVNILDSTVGWLDGVVQSQLIVDQRLYDPNTNDGLFRAWQQIRNIAYIILIPIMLVMVIGTALGFDFFSAYTIKRALPRMVIAVIFITLSWYICIFLVGFFNVLGTGVLGIITSPFDGGANGLRDALDIAGIVETGGGGAEDLASGTAAIGLAAAGIFAAFATGFVTTSILISLLGSAALVLGIAMLVLVARQMFILGFILAAPLAILAWIFPGNDKFWKIWWGSFSKLLMMFPLIMAIIALGRVFGAVIGQASIADSRNTLVTTIMVTGAYVIPFAAIPFAFKWVGGLFGTLAGMVNDRERGLLDRGRKKRTENRGVARENASNNRRWNPNGRMGKANNLAGWLASPVANTKVALGTTGGKTIMGEINQKQLEQTSKVAQMLSQAGLNDRAGRAMAGFGSTAVTEGIEAEEARTGIRIEGMRAVRNVKDLEHNAALMRRFGDDNDRLGAEQINSAAVQGIVAGAWSNPDLQKADIQAAGYMSSASQGFAERDEIALISNRSKKANGGDTGFAAQMASQLSLAAYKGGRLDMKPGYGIGYDETLTITLEDGSTMVGGYQDGLVTVQKQIDLVKTLKQNDFMQAKPKSVKALKEGIKAIATSDNPDDRFLREAMEQNVLLGASQFSSTDPGSKAEWKKIAEELSLTPRLKAMDDAAAERRGRSAGSGPAAGGGAAASGEGE